MYAKNFITSLSEGIENTKYHILQKEFEADDFFQELVNNTNLVKENMGRIFFFGNGASAAFSNHMSLDWSKNGGVLSLCLSDSAMLTALANDYDYDGCFLEFLKIYKPTSNDFIVTTSSSGNSKNIVNVLEYCQESKITSFGFSGLNPGNKTEKLADFSLFVPMKTYGMVECIHQIFHHLWLDKFMNIEEWSKTKSQNMDADNFIL